MEENKRYSTRSGYCQRCACVVCMTSAIYWPNSAGAIVHFWGAFREHGDFLMVFS